MFFISDDDDDLPPRILIQLIYSMSLTSSCYLLVDWKLCTVIPCMQWVCFRDISRVVCVLGILSSAVVSPFNTGWGSTSPNFPDWLVFLRSQAEPSAWGVFIFAGSITEQRSHHLNQDFPLRFVYPVLHLLHTFITLISAI